MKKALVIFWIICSLSAHGQPRVSFTFDDGSTRDKGGYPVEEWNQMILDKLEAANTTATFFTTGKSLSGEKGSSILNAWDQAGHQIANHTYTHPNYNSDQVSIEEFKAEIIKQDSVIHSYDNYTKLFRFPYLREGNTSDKVNELRLFLEEIGYMNGHVTIDDSDWYIDKILLEVIKENPKADLTFLRNFYVNHIFEVARRAESLAYTLTERYVSHTLLFHHNLVNALFLDAIIEKFQEEGWVIISSNEAFRDPIYHEVPDFAGNGLLDAMAHDCGMEDFLEELDNKFNTYPVASLDELKP